MNNQPKKSFAQGTIEYLIIIAIVVVIALVVVSILTGFLNTSPEISSKTQNLQQKTQLISLGEAIVTPSGNYVLEIQSNEVETINITKIITDDGYELFSGESLYLGTKKVFPIYTNEDCTEGTTTTKNIRIEYTTQHGIQKTQQFDNITIPCQNVNANNLILPTLAIKFVNPTPVNNSFLGKNNFDVNVFSISKNNISTFIDFNNSLVGWWRMDDYNSTHVLDYMGNNHGINHSTGQVEGKMGKALGFDGASSVTTNYGSGLNPYEQPITITAWVKSSTPSVSKMAFSFGSSSGTNQRAYFAHSNGKWTMGIQANMWGGGNVSATGNWTHLVITMDSGVAKMYANTELSREIDYTSYTVTGNFGLSIWGGYAWDGLIDEVTIWNRVLSEDEIQAIYAGSSEKYLDTNFSDLSNGDYFYTAYSQDTLGNIVQTEERKITIQN